MKRNLIKKFAAAFIAIALCLTSRLTTAVSSVIPDTQVAQAVQIAQAEVPAAAPSMPSIYFNKNLRLDGLDLSGFTYFGALARYGIIAEEISRNFGVSVAFGQKTAEIRAFDIGLKSNSFERLKALWALSAKNPGDASEPVDFFTEYTYDEARLTACVEKIVYENCKAYTAPTPSASEPKFDFATKTFANAFAPTQASYDPDAARKVLRSAVADAVAFTRANLSARKLLVTVDPITPPKQENAALYGLISSYETKTSNVENRNTNVRLASEATTNRVMAPGDVFSFLGLVGNTTKEKGYKEAGILVNGKAAVGMGGGICQVSSTIYNAVLEGGFKVVERHPHSAPVDYVPKGRDATVSLPATDFRFKNDTSSTIYLVVEYDNRTVRASIYGKLP